MTNAVKDLAESLRSCTDDVHKAIHQCLAFLDPGSRGDDGEIFSDPLGRPSAFALYLSEMIANHQPAALLEYLLWVQSRRQSSEVHGDRLIQTLGCLRKALKKAFPQHARAVTDFLQAVETLQAMSQTPEDASTWSQDPLDQLAQEYLQALLDTDRDRAWRIIDNAVHQGTAIKDIYLGIFQRTQYEIGRLWQLNRISVAQEHYCTASTQLMMSRLYPRFFSGSRRDLRFVAACAGGELHELGVRMVADFFEMDGWDTLYLGANTEASRLLSAVATRSPHVVGLSATMPSHVRHVEDLIRELRRHFGQTTKILVGGSPFKRRPNLWQEVGADGYAPDAQAAVTVANSMVAGTT